MVYIIYKVLEFYKIAIQDSSFRKPSRFDFTLEFHTMNNSIRGSSSQALSSRYAIGEGKNSVRMITKIPGGI